MRKTLLAGILLAVLTLTGVGTAGPAAAATLTACDGVWVVIDYGSLGGGTQTGCATSFASGTAALGGAGVTPTIDDGFVTKLNGKPTAPNPQKNYWSYWHATRQSDGSYSGWSYSNLGAGSYHPTKGNAEGWHYISLSEAASGPSVAPPKNPSASPSPTQTATHKPTATATKTVTATPTATPSPSASATPSRTSSSAQGSTTAPVATAATTRPIVTALPTQTVPTNSDAGTDTGSPIGLIVGGGIVLLGAVGVGTWWWLKGRRR